MGPNRLLFGNSSGVLARALERWQLGLIYNLSSGAPASITANNMLYGNGVPDVVVPVDFADLKGVRWGVPAGSQLQGRYFEPGKFVKVDDPQCSQITSLQNLIGTVGGGTATCTLDALAMVVPAGTANAITLPSGESGIIVLQHPQPGQRGNLGLNTLTGLPVWNFDANLSKAFRIDETKSLQIRFDARNVLNHPQPGNPNLSITGGGEFGQITTKTGGRAFQGQLRLTF